MPSSKCEKSDDHLGGLELFALPIGKLMDLMFLNL